MRATTINVTIRVTSNTERKSDKTVISWARLQKKLTFIWESGFYV